MKKTLVIGSTVADIIVKIPSLPKAGEDINIISQSQKIGGCAYNVAHILNLTNTPFILCSPVGTGLYGDFIFSELKKADIQPFIRIPNMENGCCYCIVDDQGERTFLSHHGAEYTFKKEWMDSINMHDVDSVYICGLELEEPSGIEIVEFLEEHKNLVIYFAPGPRINKIPSNIINRVFDLNPITHLNSKEIISFTKKEKIEDAILKLYKQTSNKIFVTLGKKGACYIEKGKIFTIPGVPAKIDDTIGAGDAHFGTIIASIKYGITTEQAIRRANLISSAVVSVSGSLISLEQFNKVSKSFKL